MKEKPLKDLIFYPLFRYKWTVVFTFIGIFAMIMFLTFLITPTYEASVKILVHQNPKQQPLIFEDVSLPTQENIKTNLANDFVSIAQSQEIARAIVKQFKLDERLRKKVEAPEELRDKIKKAIVDIIKYPFDLLEKYGLLESKPKDYVAEAVEDFLEDALEVELEEDTQVVKLSIWEESPSLATQIANTMAKLVIDKLIELEKQQAETVCDFIKSQLRPVEEKYLQSLRQYELFKEKWNVVSFDEEKSLKLNTLENLKSELAETLVNLEDRKKALAQVKKAIAFQEKKLESLPLYQDLLKQRAQLEIDIQSLEGRRRELEVNIQQLEAELANIIKRENEFTRLQQQKDIDEKVFLALKDKLRKFEVQKATRLSEFDIRIVDPAYVSEYADPDWPKLEIFVPLGLFVSLFTAIGLAFLLNYFDGSIRSIDDIEETFTNFPSEKIFVMKKNKKLAKNKIKVTPAWKKAVLDSFYPLSSVLLLENKGQKVVLVTSPSKDEGKTFIAVNLACSLAMRNKKTLLIDANPWHPSLSALFGLPDGPGLSEILQAEGEADYIHKDVKLSHLDVLTFGKRVSDPLELFLGETLDNLLDKLRSVYDYIIMDTSPLTTYETKKILSRAERVFLVLRYGYTNKTDLLRLKTICEVKRLAGIIFNDFCEVIPFWFKKFL